MKIFLTSIFTLLLSVSMISACPLDPSLVQGEINQGFLSQQTVNYMSTLPVEQRVVFLNSFTPNFNRSVDIYNHHFNHLSSYNVEVFRNRINNGAFFNQPFLGGGRFTERGRFHGHSHRQVGFRHHHH